jgi:hypothetical protein
MSALREVTFYGLKCKELCKNAWIAYEDKGDHDSEVFTQIGTIRDVKRECYNYSVNQASRAYNCAD